MSNKLDIIDESLWLVFARESEGEWHENLVLVGVYANEEEANARAEQWDDAFVVYGVGGACYSSVMDIHYS